MLFCMFQSSRYRWKNYFPSFGGHLLTHVWDSGHIQLANHRVFDEESDVQVKHVKNIEPGAKA